MNIKETIRNSVTALVSDLIRANEDQIVNELNSKGGEIAISVFITCEEGRVTADGTLTAFSKTVDRATATCTADKA